MICIYNNRINRIKEVLIMSIERKKHRGRKPKTNEYNSIFSQRLRELIDKNNLTLPELAIQINTTRQSIGQWKNGDTVPNIIMLKSIAEFFNVSADYLLGLTENTSTNISEIGISNKTGFSTSTVENILNLSAEHKTILDKIINELLKSDLLEKFEELKENNIKLINLYQTDSIYNKLVEDEELTYNTIDNADELNGKFIFKDEYSKLLLFEIKYIFFDIIRNLSDYNKMIELKKDSEKGYNED